MEKDGRRKNAMNIGLSGKNAFVTGGSRIIGKAIAETLADCGANVGVMARGREAPGLPGTRIRWGRP